MIPIEEKTLRELVLKTEPGFLAQAELSINGFGTTRTFSENGDPVWIWTKERVRTATTADLNYLVAKIIE